MTLEKRLEALEAVIDGLPLTSNNDPEEEKAAKTALHFVASAMYSIAANLRDIKFELVDIKSKL